MAKTIGCLTTFRFFFAAMIVYHHAQFLPEHEQFRPWFNLKTGVSCFFVLSGFILSHNYPSLTSAGARFAFICHRIGRIWPVHVVTLLVCLALLKGDAWHAIVDSPNFSLNLFLLQSWYPNLAVNWDYNIVAWSISVEMFFYLAFIWLAGKSMPKIALVSVACLTLTWILGRLHDCEMKNIQGDIVEPGFSCFSLVYTFPPMRMLEFCAGIASYKLYRFVEQRFTPAPLTGTAIECVTLGSFALWIMFMGQPVFDLLRLAAGDSIFAAYEAFAYTFPAACALFIVFALEAGALSRLLNWRPLVFLGEISFSLYMVHAVIGVVLQKYLDASDPMPFGLILVTFFGVSIVASVAVFLIIEEPCRLAIKRAMLRRSALWLRFKRWLKPRTRLLAVVAAFRRA